MPKGNMGSWSSLFFFKIEKITSYLYWIRNGQEEREIEQEREKVGAEKMPLGTQEEMELVHG